MNNYSLTALISVPEGAGYFPPTGILNHIRQLVLHTNDIENLVMIRKRIIS